MGESDHSVESDPFQNDISQKASSLSGYTPLHSGKEVSFPRMGESDHLVGIDLLQSGAFRNFSSGVYPSLYHDTPGGFQVLAPAESKKTLQKGNTL